MVALQQVGIAGEIVETATILGEKGEKVDFDLVMTLLRVMLKKER